LEALADPNAAAEFVSALRELPPELPPTPPVAIVHARGHLLRLAEG